MSTLQTRIPKSLSGLREQSDSPIVRWSVLVIAVILIWVWIVEPLQTWKGDLHGQVGRTAERAARLVAMEQNADKWIVSRNQLQSIAAEVKAQMFSAVSDTQAQAEMQTLLQQMASARHLVVDSQKLIPPEPDETMGSRLAVQLGVRGEVIDILLLLDDISRSAKLLVIEDWSMQMQKDDTVFARITLVGFRLEENEGPAGE